MALSGLFIFHNNVLTLQTQTFFHLNSPVNILVRSSVFNFKGTVSWDINFWSSREFNRCFMCMRANSYKSFICLAFCYGIENICLPTDTLLKCPPQCPTLYIPHWKQAKLAKIYLSQVCFRTDFSGSLTVFHMIFQGQNHRCRAFEK
jgi:hypothetical protein